MFIAVLGDKYFNMRDTFRLIFGGDVCLKDSVNISQEIIDMCTKSDFTVLNLEAPIISSTNFKPLDKSGPCLYQNKAVFEIFSKMKVGGVGGANNHLMDYGADGLFSTLNLLDQENILHCGFGKNISEAKKPILINGSNIIIISACEREFGEADSDKAGVYCFDSNIILEQIRELKKTKKFVIIFAHGGGEEIPIPPEYIINRYHNFIEAGADLVIGHHPHVIQGFEKYLNKYIYYSLGNFYHSSFQKSLGMLLEIEIKANKSVVINPIPIVSKNQSVDKLSDNEHFKRIIERLNSMLTKENRDLISLEGFLALEEYYLYYFNNLFTFSKASKIKHFFANLINPNFQKKYSHKDLLLLLNLIRNNSHRELIYKGLEIKTKQKIVTNMFEKKDELKLLIEVLKGGEFE